MCLPGGRLLLSQRFLAMYDRFIEKERRTRQSLKQASVRQKRSGIVSMSLTDPGRMERTENDSM
jgi:hypothetical protein